MSSSMWMSFDGRFSSSWNTLVGGSSLPLPTIVTLLSDRLPILFLFISCNNSNVLFIFYSLFLHALEACFLPAVPLHAEKDPSSPANDSNDDIHKQAVPESTCVAWMN